MRDPIDPASPNSDSSASSIGKVDAIDFAYLAAQTFGDVALENELLDLFVVQARRIMAGLPSQSVGERCDALHLIKGSARAIGANPVAAAAEAYERALRDEGHADQDHFRALASAFDNAQEAIDARRG